MKIKMRACFYSLESGVLDSVVNLEQIKTLGFDSSVVKGDIDNLFKHFNDKIVNVLIIEDTGFTAERFNQFINLLYENYCKNIIVVTDVVHKKSQKFYYVNKQDLDNFDLSLAECLLSVKNKIMQLPSHSIKKVKSAVHEFLVSLKFSPKNSGFTYFVDAITITFFNYPVRVNIMDMYEEIGKTYGRRLCAVEKAMRTALANAIIAVRRLPDVPENRFVKDFVKHDLTNSLLINMIVGKLLVDGEFGEEFYSRV